MRWTSTPDGHIIKDRRQNSFEADFTDVMLIEESYFVEIL